MRALDRKLARDLWHLRGMVAAIGLVLVGGISTFVMALSVYQSLELTRDRYYRSQRFADVFASLERAPMSVSERLRDVAGVDQVQTRVVGGARIEIEGFDDPVNARLVSLPAHGDAVLNQPYLRSGRLPEPVSDDEVIVSESFALAQGMRAGAQFEAVLQGRRRTLTVVGVALSPEFVYSIAPGSFFPDPKRYGILWMRRPALESAYGMDGAFNDVTLRLQAGTRVESVLERVDEILDSYGGQGAYSRNDQLSHRFLTEELNGLATMARVFPVIFLGVAAFLLNVVVTRLVNTQREQVAILKAFGYSTFDVASHYTKLVLAITAVGLAGGLALGTWFARGLAGIYIEFYNFPYLEFVLSPAVIVSAALVSFAAALAGTILSVRRAAALPPAQGMLPEPPPTYRATLLERLGLQQRLAEPTRMILRHVTRNPLKATLSVAGIASAYGILMITNFQRDSISYMLDVEYGLSQRDDVTVTFVEPTSQRAVYSLGALPGVQRVEGYRAVPARLMHDQRTYRTPLEGIERGADMRRVLDAELEPVYLPQHGVVLTDYLAGLLKVEPGDMLTVEVLEGERPLLRVPVAAVTQQYLGVGAFISRDGLNRLMREAPALSGAYLAVDPAFRERLFDELEDTPRVAGITMRQTAIDQFHDMMDESILFFALVTALLGSFIAFGVVYNSGRIALSERSREFASLRVLGFTLGEIAYILLGELTVLTLLAIPPGLAFGYGLSALLAQAFASDLYRIPLVIQPETYATATLIVLGSLLVTCILLLRRLARLDLVGVLKTRE